MSKVVFGPSKKLGYHIKTYMKETGISQRRLSASSGLSTKQICLILGGKASFTEDFMSSIEALIPSMPRSNWSYLYESYKKEESSIDEEEYKAWDKAFNLSKYFSKQPNVSKSEQVEIIKRAFDITKPQEKRFNGIKTSDVYFLSKGKCSTKNQELLETWIVLSLDNFNYDGLRHYVGFSKLKKELESFKTTLCLIKDEITTLKNINEFTQRCGIAFVVEPSPISYVKGATFFKGSRPVILLSYSWRNVEELVYTFIHEVFHLIHNDIGFDEISFVLSKSQQEDAVEASVFDFLVDWDSKSQFVDEKNQKGCISKETIISIAKRNNISQSLLVYALQQEHIIAYCEKWNYLHSVKG